MAILLMVLWWDHTRIAMSAAEMDDVMVQHSGELHEALEKFAAARSASLAEVLVAVLCWKARRPQS